MKKLFLIIIVLGLIGLAIFVLLRPASPSKDRKQALGPITTRAAKDVGQLGPTAAIIQNNSFLPPQLLVKKGTKVTWTNQDSQKHSVVVDAGSPPGGPNGPLLAKGQTYSFVFDTVGTYQYHAGDRPTMHGTVVVTE